MKRGFLGWTLVALLLAGTVQMGSAPRDRMIGINVVLNTDITPDHLTALGQYGRVRTVVYEIKAVTLQAARTALPVIRALPFVLAANPDAKRQGAPVDTVPVTNFLNGRSTWNLDAVNVTPSPGVARAVDYDGTGVYVAVLDTGLVDSWRRYFPQERVAVEYAKCFGGGGMDMGFVSEQPNKWEHDQNSHGTHVTSTIIGYQFGATQFNGVAPMAKIIPVKVLSQSGWGWSSVISEGIVYIARLKEGALANYPVVINMSLSGGALDAMEKAAIDYAIGNGVIIVAAAGNRGTAGMGYPGAYAPVISVGACGWLGEWLTPSWWYNLNIADPTNPAHFYIADFSSRAKPGQDLDVVAPGTWVVGPYQINSGQLSYYYLGGTSMSSPHVAGIAALMAQKYPGLTATQAEEILQASALGLLADPDATGSGLVQADAALAITP
jgi:subtilisin family serine protease